MLELIFQGFVEWLYSLTLEAWEYFGSAMLNVMSLDFAYLKSHIPIIPDIQQILLATGWALLIGNLVFQSAKSMITGLGFEGEDPKLLFTRTFVFSFLLLASPQICDIGLSLTSTVMELLQVPDAVNVHLVDNSAFGSITVSWLLVIIFDLIIMFQVFKLLLEIAERYVILAMLTITAPLAFGVGGSRSTSDIFTGWCRMYGSMCLLMVTHVIFFKMLLSVLSAVPSGLDTLLWMILILSIVKVAKKTDNIITRIGLNPAFTGDSLRVVPGALSYVVLRQAASQVTKSLGKATGGTGRGRSAGSGPRGWGPRSGGPRGTGSPGGVSNTYNNPSTASASVASSDSSTYTSASKVALSAASSVNSTTAAPLIASTGDSPTLLGSKPPNVPPGSGPINPDSPMPVSPVSQIQQNRFQPQIRQSGIRQISGDKIDPEPHIPAIPPTPGEAMPSHPAATPTSPSRSGAPDLPGKAGKADPSAPHQPIAPSGRVPSDQAAKLSTRATQHTGVNAPPKPADRQPGVALPSNPALKRTPDPGSTVTTHERSAEARFSHREAHTPGRASSLIVQDTQSTKERPSKSAGEVSPQATRFTTRPSTPGVPSSDSTRREHISTSEIKSTRQSAHVGSVSGTAKVMPPSAAHPAPGGHATEATTVNRPGTAGKPSSPAAASPSPLPRQGRNGAPRPAEPSTTPAGSRPASQERRPSDISPASSASPTSQPGQGTAGMGAPSIAPSPDRAPRQSRNEAPMPARASTPVAAPSPAPQEGGSPVRTPPRSTAPIQRSSPGTAGTAVPPRQAATPVKPSDLPTRPSRPAGQTPPAIPPDVKLTSHAVKVAPAMKAAPAPTDTRLKRGYPAKPTKGGKKRHGR